jgi:hypothetical protein
VALAQIEGVTIVLVGSFNPAIFHPSWLAAHNLIRREEADSAIVEVVHPELASISIAWAQLQVTRDRFQAATLDPAHFEHLLDLVAGVFAVLAETPASAVGLNYNIHRAMSEEKRDALAERIAPKGCWGPLVKEPKLRSMTILGGAQRGPESLVTIIVEPSVRINPGVYTQVNRHYQPTDPTVARLLADLKADWSDALDDARRIVEAIHHGGIDS